MRLCGRASHGRLLAMQHEPRLRLPVPAAHTASGSKTMPEQSSHNITPKLHTSLFSVAPRPMSTWGEMRGVDVGSMAQNVSQQAPTLVYALVALVCGANNTHPLASGDTQSNVPCMPCTDRWVSCRILRHGQVGQPGSWAHSPQVSLQACYVTAPVLCPQSPILPSTAHLLNPTSPILASPCRPSRMLWGFRSCGCRFAQDGDHSMPGCGATSFCMHSIAGACYWHAYQHAEMQHACPELPREFDSNSSPGAAHGAGAGRPARSCQQGH